MCDSSHFNSLFDFTWFIRVSNSTCILVILVYYLYPTLITNSRKKYYISWVFLAGIFVSSCFYYWLKLSFSIIISLLLFNILSLCVSLFLPTLYLFVSTTLNFVFLWLNTCVIFSITEFYLKILMQWPNREKAFTGTKIPFQLLELLCAMHKYW